MCERVEFGHHGMIMTTGIKIVAGCCLLIAILNPAPSAQGQVEPDASKQVRESRPARQDDELATAAEGFQLEGERWTYRDGDFKMSGILLKPAEKGPFPAVLISHGRGGSAESFGLNKAREMVKWGFVCIAPNYTHTGGPGGMQRGGRRVGGPEAKGAPLRGPRGGQNRGDDGASAENIRRARTCLDILSKMPEVDAKRLAAYGHSMGGFVTIGLAAAEPDRLKAAAITGSGIGQRAGFPAPSAESAEKVRTPFLIVHGSDDTVVRPEQSAAFKKILDGNQVANDHVVVEGQGHPIDQTMRDETFRRIREWFAKHGLTNS
jgi:dienelactone hydrolase